MNFRKKENGVPAKPPCPEAGECREMKQDHFRETSHYHLEKYLVDKLWEKLVIPRPLPFGRYDRGVFSQQIRNLQVIMREDNYQKERLSDLKRRIEAEKLEGLKKPPVQAITTLSVVKTERPMMNSSKRPASISPPISPKRYRIIGAVPSSWKLPLCNEFDQSKTIEDRRKYFKIALEKMKEFNEATLHLKSPGDFLMKYEQSKPYNVFLSSLQDVQITWSKTNSITFPEILDLSLGEIEKSFYITNRVDIDWLRFQYLLAGQKSDSFIICGSYFCSEKLPENIQVHKVDKQNSQIIVLKYAKGVRIIVTGAGLEEKDWRNVTQIVWISPHLRFLQDGYPGLGESKTGFKKDFIYYLLELKNYCKFIPQMIDWLNVLLHINFALVNVFFLGSVPGVYRGKVCDRWGLGKLSTLLSTHAELGDVDDGNEEENWPIVVQVPFILRLGSFQVNQEEWFKNEFISTMSKLAPTNRHFFAPEFKCIFPSLENRDLFIENDFDSLLVWYPTCYSTKQAWFEKYLCQWKTGSKGRNKSKPGSKIYTRISELKRSPWVVITSAALWTGGWGHQTRGEDQNQDNLEREIYFDSFDAGVVFFPKFVTGGKTFSLQDVDEKGTPPFPVPFDIPLTPYKFTDKPCES